MTNFNDDIAFPILQDMQKMVGGRINSHNYCDSKPNRVYLYVESSPSTHHSIVEVRYFNNTYEIWLWLNNLIAPYTIIPLGDPKAIQTIVDAIKVVKTAN